MASRPAPPHAWRSRVADPTGDILLGWLVRLLLVVGVLVLVAYEGISIGVTYVGLDDDARDVALAARDAYRSGATETQTTQVAEEAATEVDASLVALEVDDASLTVTLDREAPTLVLHRFGPTEDLATATVSRTVDVTS